MHGHPDDKALLWAAIESIAPKIFGLPQILYESVHKHGANSGLRDGVTSDERDRINALEPEVKEPRRANGGCPISREKTPTQKSRGLNTGDGRIASE